MLAAQDDTRIIYRMMTRMMKKIMLSKKKCDAQLLLVFAPR